MYIYNIQKAHAVFFFSVSHLLEIIVHVPGILTLYRLPVRVGVVVAVASLVTRENAPESRTVDFCVRVETFDHFRKRNGFRYQFLVGNLVFVQQRMCVIPEYRFVVQIVSLYTGRSGGVSQVLNQIVDILIHVNGIVGQIRCV